MKRFTRNEIMKMYPNKIKFIKNSERKSVTYFCDVYLYNSQEEKERLSKCI